MHATQVVGLLFVGFVAGVYSMFVLICIGGGSKSDT
jgi:hypothetical protein